jgi:hypothetical protein
MQQSHRDLIQQGKDLFSKKMTFDSMCQDIAENFYPERANFTAPHVLGEEFATQLYSSYPLLVRRELGDTFTTLSRPQGEQWFYMGLTDEDREDQQAREWMEGKTRIQRRVMYDPNSRFTRSMKEGDHDWVTFGQCALSVEINKARNGLLYRNWHLRDMAWCEGYSGAVDMFWRKWKPTVRQLKQYFGADALHKNCQQHDDKTQQKEINCMHIFVPRESHEISELPYVSLFVDVDNEHIIEEKPMAYRMYAVPRWATVSDSQYAYSPAIIAGLPSARLYQDMTRVILEAGQKAVDPPMIGVSEMIGSAIDLQPGGFTAVSAEYDERLGEVLRPLSVDKSGIPLGMNLLDRVQAELAQALYIDKLNLPRGGDMTAFETSIRFQEYIRTILPVFEPKEAEMEAQICQMSFDILWRHGAFGSVRDLPQSMQGADYQFKFVSPLSKAIEEKKTNVFYEVSNVLKTAAAIDQTVLANLDVNKATRDALIGAGADADWLNEEDQVEQSQAGMRQQAAAEQEMALTQQAKELISE